MRLGDLDALSEKMKGTNRYFDIKFDIDEMPTIDPETLPIVKELRAENKKLTEALGDSFAIDLMNKLEKVERERDGAIEILRDIAFKTKPCLLCKHWGEKCSDSFHWCDKRHELWKFCGAKEE